MDSSPFFSICVPTRNRAETLYHCLKTLLHQDFDSYEIIVSDNCDAKESEETYKVVQELNSDKIKYFRQDTVLSMTANYEFALSRTKGKFITCLGDDDGLVVNSLQYVHDFIRTYKATVVKCCEICYWWPGSNLFPNSILSYPLERPVVQVLSKSVLEKVANFEIGYFNLPMLYYSFVSRSIIDEVIKEKGSFFQNSASIDMYSGFTIAHRTDSFFVTDKPFSICGQSNKSNGATVISTYDNKISREYLAQHSLKEIYNKYQIPFMSQFSMPLFVSLELSKFSDNYKVSRDDLNIQFKNIFIDSLSKSSTINVDSINELVDKFREYLKYEEDIRFVQENFLGKQVYYPKLGNHDTNINKYMEVDPLLFDVHDVYGASLLSKEIMDSKKSRLPLKIPMATKINPLEQNRRSLATKIGGRLKKVLRVLLHG
jgi:glycosyltransferase involved in cell wall biosynthesis